MARHHDLKSLLRESLTEYLLVAEYCAAFRKDSKWPAEQLGGCLGYPAAVMMFSIVDTIGSFHRGQAGLNVIVDGRARNISTDGSQHFFILNSVYYGQALDGKTIKALYDNFRCLLVHNAALAPEGILLHRPDIGEAFPLHSGRPMVNVPAFLQISRGAVERFLARADAVVPGSQQTANIGKKG